MRSNGGKQFRELQKEWYDRLEKEGFEDIENSSGLPKQWALNFFRNEFNQIRYEATVEYYSKAQRLLHRYSFRNDIDKRIWELHCEGLTVREISLRIKTYKKSMVHNVISEISRMIKK